MCRKKNWTAVSATAQEYCFYFFKKKQKFSRSKCLETHHGENWQKLDRGKKVLSKLSIFAIKSHICLGPPQQSEEALPGRGHSPGRLGGSNGRYVLVERSLLPLRILTSVLCDHVLSSLHLFSFLSGLAFLLPRLVFQSAECHPLFCPACLLILAAQSSNSVN